MKTSKNYRPVTDFLSQYAVAEKTSNLDGPAFVADNTSMYGAPSAVSIQYKVIYQNTTNTTLTAILFGFNKYFGSASQYGSDTGIVVTSGTTNVSYPELLAQSGSNPFNIGKLRFVVTAGSNSNLDQEVTVNYRNANGVACTIPLDLSAYVNEFQQQNNRVTVQCQDVKVDGNTYLQIPVVAATTLAVSVWPGVIADISRPVYGAAPIQGYILPQINGVPFISNNCTPQGPNGAAQLGSVAGNSMTRMALNSGPGIMS